MQNGTAGRAALVQKRRVDYRSILGANRSRSVRSRNDLADGRDECPADLEMDQLVPSMTGGVEYGDDAFSRRNTDRSVLEARNMRHCARKTTCKCQC